MPTEIRRLIFSNRELALALTDHLHALPGSEVGTILAVEIGKEKRVVVRAQVQLSTGRQTTKAFDEAALCSALIGYCLNNRIPLSRKGEKAVHRTATGAIVLDIAIRGDPV